MRSADVRRPFRGLRLGCGGWLSGKLEYCCFLILKHIRQKGHLPVWEFQGIVMCPRLMLIDLPEDGCGVLNPPYSTAEPPPSDLTPYLVSKGQFRSRKNTDRGRDIFRGREPSSASIEVVGFQFVTNLGWTGLNIVQAVIAHATPRELPLTGKTPGTGVSSDWMGLERSTGATYPAERV
jgi:hypothetical protein